MQRDWKTTKANLDSEERVLLRDLARLAHQQQPSPVIVNIGIYHSGSMYCLRAGAPEAHLTGIDIRKVYRPAKELNAMFICAASQDCHQHFELPIHLLFVDGDHHYEAAMSDLVNWGSKVVPGGIMAVHDYYAPGVAEARYPGKPYLQQLLDVKRAVDVWAAKHGHQWTYVKVVGRTIVFQRK